MSPRYKYHWVKPYRRKDGTYVKRHWAKNPNQEYWNEITQRFERKI